MSTPDIPSQEPSRRASIPRWMAPIIWTVGIVVIHLLLPWLISLMTTRYGWIDGRPGLFNLLALIPILLGMAGMIWGLVMHYVSAPDRAEWGWAPNYLILKGPYEYSRNPMYASEVLFWLGWAAFYGSITVLIAAMVFWMFLNFFGIPGEERALEARFGETYRQYKNAVPRWFGKTRH